jgi:dTDP-4-dehydrorhamnose reductase
VTLGIATVHVAPSVVVNASSGDSDWAGPDALSRHDLGVLIAGREGLGGVRLPAGRRADSCLPGALDVRLDSRATQQRLRTRLRGAREFLGGDGCADSGAAAANH